MDKHSEYMEKMIREQIDAEKYEEERSKRDDKKTCIGGIPDSCVLLTVINKMSESVSALSKYDKINTDPDYITSIIDLYRSQRMLINLAKHLESEGK